MGRHREDVFNKREMEILVLVSQGLSNSSVAHKLGISLPTVHKHIESIRKKTGLHTHPQSLSSILQMIFTGGVRC